MNTTLAKFNLRYDKLMVDEDIYTFNEITGQVGNKILLNCMIGMLVCRCSLPCLAWIMRMCPWAQPVVQIHRTTSSLCHLAGKRISRNHSQQGNLYFFLHELHFLIFISDSALNYFGENTYNGDNREPSPTKSIMPLPED